ncbi:hypothetical protein [Seonamhaeicola sp. ML3]|uniref:hypothetical protein n=1 Tax=Seonamhaeicola sp. ML3 TaxID=2937786 RepID=UPI0020107F76|nr:hypothetical protein [Seonamhaeicola sp. ML3]
MRILYCICFILLFNACDTRNDVDENCRFLLDINVNLSINLSLPQYSELQFAGNSVYIPNVGNGGIIVASTGFDFFAWDASDPNKPPSNCSVLVPNGLFATSGCEDENTYNLITGEPTENPNLRCSLKFYRIERNGNTLLIFN